MGLIPVISRRSHVMNIDMKPVPVHNYLSPSVLVRGLYHPLTETLLGGYIADDYVEPGYFEGDGP